LVNTIYYLIIFNFLRYLEKIDEKAFFYEFEKKARSLSEANINFFIGEIGIDGGKVK